MALALMGYEHYMRPQDAPQRQLAGNLLRHGSALFIAFLTGQDAETRRKSGTGKGAYFAEGFHEGANARANVMNWYITMGKWPTDNKEAGFKPANDYQTRALAQLEVSGRVITLTFRDETPVGGGTIQLVAEGTEVSAIRWRCVIASYPDIKWYLPDCEYVRALAPAGG
ncbi:MAG: pilin [Nevskiales bacterium]